MQKSICLKLGLFFILILCGTLAGTRCWAQFGDFPAEYDSASASSSAVWRGNYAALDIAPFKWRVVGTGYGGWGNYSERAGDPNDYSGAFKTTIFGGTLGGDWLLTENCFVGIQAHAGRINIDPNHLEFDGGITSIGGIGRISIFGNRWYWDASLGAAGNRNAAEFVLDGYDCTANKTVLQMNYQTEIGLKLNSGFTKVEPFAGFRYITLGSGGLGLENTGDSARKNFESSPYSARSMIGSRFSWEFSTFLATIRPSLHGMWVHEFGDRTVFTSDDTLLFPIAGEFGHRSFSRDHAVLGAGASAALRDMVDLFIDYSCSFAAEESLYSVSGGIHIKY